MRLSLCALTFLAVAMPAAAQRHKMTTINAETPEGQLLQQIGQESDDARKLELMAQFADKYPKHEAILWVYSQMIPAYSKSGQWEKTLETCAKLLEGDPEDAEDAHACLKAAEAKKDPDLIRIWAARAAEVAKTVAQLPKPAEEGEVAVWAQRVDFAQQFLTYTEYAVYAAALASTDPKKKIELYEALERRNPQSQYLPQLAGQYFIALRQTGAEDRAIAAAEKFLAKDDSNEDMLVVVADHYMNRAKDPDKVIVYAGKLVAVMERKARPEGVSAEDWEKKKKLMLGLGHWMTGVTYSTQNKFLPADKELRVALPLVQDNQDLLPGALFHLGVVNFKLGDAKGGDEQRIIDALKFSQQCAAMKSPFQAYAQQNVKAIRARYHVQ